MAYAAIFVVVLRAYVLRCYGHAHRLERETTNSPVVGGKSLVYPRRHNEKVDAQVALLYRAGGAAHAV
jgi:hypothetical protein